MAYKYEKVDQKLLVPQIEDQLMMYVHQEQMEKGARLPSEHKLGEFFGVGRSTIREAVKSIKRHFRGQKRFRDLCEKYGNHRRRSIGIFSV